jgi:hypothetical protein
MGTAHGAEELGLCPHGRACQAGAWGRYRGFAEDMAIFEKSNIGKAGKNILQRP